MDEQRKAPQSEAIQKADNLKEQCKDTNNPLINKELNFDFSNFNKEFYKSETETTENNEFENELNNCFIDIEREYTPPPPILQLAGEYVERVTVFSKGDISAVTGKAKSRKTFFNVLIASYILSENDTNTVLYIDTEQGKDHTKKIADRIYKFMDWENLYNPRVNIYALREFNTEKRFKSVEFLITRHSPTIVFLDGVRDILYDFNDAKESAETINTLMRLSTKYQTHILCVLHENKGANTEMRGHLGTELQNKSETVISITKKNDISEVIPRYCKNGDFKAFSFSVVNGLPAVNDSVLETRQNAKLRALLNELLPCGVTKSYSELTDLISEKKGITNEGAKKNIKNATENGLIKKNGIGHYYSSDNNLNNEENETEGLPF